MAVEERAQEAARDAQDHPALGWPARLGYVAYGVVYGVIGWLAAQLALGDREGAASGQGAMHQLAEQPLGAVALWVCVVGLAGLVVWQVCRAVAGHRDRDGGDRVRSRLGSAGRAVVFAVLASSAASTALGSGGGGGGTDGYTAKVMGLPFGPWLVGAAGLAIVGYGIYSAVKGLTDRWRKELDASGQTGEVGRAMTILARVGFVARGVAFGVIGGLLVWAAFTHDPEKSAGLDQALVKLRDAPAGPVLLMVVAIGLVCFGAFNVGKAFHLKEG